MFFIIIITFFIVFLSFYIFFKPNLFERFEVEEEVKTKKVIEQPNYITAVQAEPIITSKISFVLNPVITTLNTIIDNVNVIPKKLYCNSMKLAESISSRFSEYSESMRYYNRDDDFNNVTIGRRNKVFIENIQTKKEFIIFKEYANKLYYAKFEDHDDIIWAFLLAYSTVHPKLAELVQLKSDDINGEDGKIDIKCK